MVELGGFEPASNLGRLRVAAGRCDFSANSGLIIALYIGTVFYEVIQLRRSGERLRFEEWPAPEFGRISMSTWRPGRNALLRTARVATLYTNAWSMQRTAMILIEPRLAYVPLDGEVWEGTQLQNSEQGVIEMEQAWLVRPTKKDAHPLPPFDVKRWMEYRRSSGDVPQPSVGTGWIKPGRRHDRGG